MSIINNPENFKDTEEKIIVLNHKRAVETLTRWILNPEYEIEESLNQEAYAQAFADGNKRTARLVSNIPLISQKKIPHIFSSIAEDDFDKVIVYYYETGDARPLERIWVESYIEGTSLFKVVQKDFRTANLERAELSPLRWLAMKEIVEKQVAPSRYIDIAKKIIQTSHLKAKYPAETLLEHVKEGLQKLLQTSIGALAHEIAEQDIEAWRKITKKH